MPGRRSTPLGLKFTVGFYAVIAIMLLVGLYGFRSVSEMERRGTEIVETAPLVDAAMEMRLAVANCLRTATEVSHTRDPEDIDEFWKDHQHHVLLFSHFSNAILNGGRTPQGHVFKARLPHLRELVERSIVFHQDSVQDPLRTLFELVRASTLGQLSEESRTRIRAEQDKVQRGAIELEGLLSQVEEAARLEIQQTHEILEEAALSYSRWALPGMTFGVLVSIAFGVFVTSYILKHVSLLVDFAHRMADGELPEPVRYNSRDEIGLLSRSLNAILESSKAIVQQTRRIAGGDYETAISHRSEKDTLADALVHMTRELKRSREDREEQSWLNTQHTELHEAMRGEPDADVLAISVLNHLARTLNIQVGALYVPDEKSELRIIGSYAFRENDAASIRFRVGEGLVGQAALEKRIISVENVPQEYLRVSSSLGTLSPRNIIVAPLFHEGFLVGILEMGAFTPLDPLKIRFLEEARDDIAIALYSAENREQMRQLLAQTRKQANHLQMQQEELRQTNEELEQQARALRASEERLQMQQEELKAINEELEERNRALETQRDAIRNKNDELKLAKEEIERKARALDLASKYKSEFLANMSHELRTPLNSILILSQLLCENKEGKLTEKEIEFSRTIHASGTDLLSLINEVLDLSKIEAGKTEVNFEHVPVDDLLEAVEKTFRPVAERKNLHYSIQKEDGLPTAFTTDRQRVYQILNNLLSNAFKFTDQGTISLRVFRTGADSVPGQNGLGPGDVLAFSVRDTGIGIAQNKQDVIFEAFQQADGTTSRQYGGTGLGLSISRELAHLLGGELGVESRPGKGSSFTLYLPERSLPRDTPVLKTTERGKPRARRKPLLQEVEGERGRPRLLDGIRDDRHRISEGDKVLLIIEDDPNFCRVLVNLARERDFKCLVSGDGESGLHFADYYRPHAIILDVALPQMDGWTVMERLKSNPGTRHIPVHFISSSDNGMEAMKLGAVGFLTKPADLRDFENAFNIIQRVISRPVKKLLLVEDDPVHRQSILELIGNGDVESTAVGSAAEAIDRLGKDEFDCMILDLGSKGTSGFDLLSRVKEMEKQQRLPIVVYTGRELTPEENAELEKYAESVIIKWVRSHQRLLDETTLFLHRVETNLPEEKQSMLRMLHNRESTLHNRKILVVDDDMRNVFALSHVLEENGMKVIVGRNGLEGLQKLADHPDTDLVLMDIMMPEMNGYDAMKEIRKNPAHSTLPIVALTAKAMKGDRQKCIRSGANDYLAKPVDMDRLISLLKVWLYRKVG